jgi:type I restriction-modification system DNA methylase subunit
MSLFQKTVVQKYLKQLNPELISAKYLEFKTYFGNTYIQDNIRNSKEEQFQEGFLRELFVNILGYSLNPAPDFNLTTEYKNIKDSKKADGAIIFNNAVKAVIELKGTNTTDLAKIEAQAFGYKNNQHDCVYVITSNFEKLRFYIDNAIEHIEFNLFSLTKPDFENLYLCLSAESIEKGIPKKIKEESLSQEDTITKKLYQDYSLFKRELHQNLVALNPQFDSLTLFKKSQKLLDRFLFLFFAEDRQLLPPNSVRLILNDWRDLQERDVEIPLYDRFKKYFEYLYTGYKGKRYDVFAYNGGLFKPDNVLDAILIDDELLFRHTNKLSEYDFVSEVDVNILGHIFENSLNELDEINAQLAGETIDKTKTKRKKDGVFYTPKYITKYIVENTVGKLCSEKKAELQLIDEEYTTDKKRQLKTKQALLEKLKTYQSWLLQLTICDPACGSGAFLNQALDFLMKEHSYIDELQAKLLGVPMILSDYEKSILENNLFGVDLNEESVEIAKLSLWLRTAQPNRKLNDLNNNIKCGNSLIDDPAVAGNKAFDWELEFPQVFGLKEIETSITEVPKDKTPDYIKLIKEKSLEAQTKAEQALALSKDAAELSKKVYEYAEKLDTVSDIDSLYGISKGGFDVVIGNPPYVHLEKMKDISEALSKMNYKTFDKRGDLYCLFVEKGFDILKPNGIISYIMPNKWLQAGYGKPLREYFLSFELNQLIDFGDIQIFEGATTYPCIFVSRKAKPKTEFKVSVLKEANKDDFYTNVNQTAETFKVDQFSGETWIVSSSSEQKLIERLKTSFKTLADFVGGEAYYGLKTGLTEAFLINETTKTTIISEDPKSIELIKPFLLGRDAKAYATAKAFSYLILLEKGFTKNRLGKTVDEEEAWNWLKRTYPAIAKWLEPYEDRGKNRTDKGDYWWEIRACDYYEMFAKPKIMYQKFQVKPCFIFDESGLYCNDSMWIIPTNDKGLLAVLNSKMGWWLITKYCTQIQNGCQLIWKYFGQIPVPTTNDDLAMKADQMLSLTKQLQETAQKFQRTIQRKFNLEELSGKLKDWYLLSYAEFIKELGKKRVKLSLSEEAEWEDYFIQEQKIALEIKHKIDATDKEIDQMVYELYGLTDDEIAIVENS